MRNRTQSVLAASALFGMMASLPISQPSAATTMNILWIGNSFTFNNSISTVAKNMINQGQTAIVVNKSDISVNWNRGLIYHWKDGGNLYGPKTLVMVRSKSYSHIVLQDYMLDPYSDNRYLNPISLEGSYGRDTSRVYTGKFIAEVKKNGGIPLVYCTWPEERNRKAWDTLIALYKKVADDSGALFVPASAAWKLALEEQPTLKFWDPDGAHPSKLGIYTNACVFYAVFTGESPVGKLLANEVDATTGAFVQQKAWQAYEKYCKKTATVNPLTVHIVNRSDAACVQVPFPTVLLTGRSVFAPVSESVRIIRGKTAIGRR